MMLDGTLLLLEAHRAEFLAECEEKGMTESEAAACLADFEAEARIVSIEVKPKTERGWPPLTPPA